MRKAKVSLIKSILVFSMFTKTKNPVQWKFISKKVGDQTYEVHLTAFIDYPWRIYSQYSAEEGPLPTIIKFKENPLIIFNGKLKEVGNEEEKYDVNYRVVTRYYVTTVDFIQVVQTSSPFEPMMLDGKLIFMVCTDKQSLAPKEIEFKVKLD